MITGSSQSPVAPPQKPPLKPFVDFLRNRSSTFRSSGKSFLLAVLVGLAVGAGAIAFSALGKLVMRYSLVEFAGYTPLDAEGETPVFAGESSTISPWMIVLVTTVGSLVAGTLVYTFAPNTAGAGTDAAIDAFHNGRGQIEARDPIVKMLASAIALGTGASGGREGPICQIGAGIGSLVGRVLRLSPRDRRILLAAGMGAGVGAIFRAPLAGAVFAAEILYSEAELEADVIVPAATASIVSYSLYTQTLSADIRFQPLFGSANNHAIESPLALLPYAALAVVLACVGIAYVRIFLKTQSIFQQLPIVPHVRPAIGAFLAGMIGIGIFYATDFNPAALSVLGTGYGTLQLALQASINLGAPVLIAVAVAKIFTTVLTISSGGPGGVFAPSMVIGGCLSAALGLIFQDYAPSLVNPEAFAIVGMAGFFAAVANAPISTIIMVRALTGDFGLLVPTMLVTSVTFVFARSMRLYTKQVPTRMDSPAHRGDFVVDVLEGIPVSKVSRSIEQYFLINESMSLDEIVHRLADNHQHYFPVVDDQRRMVGIFSDDDVRSYLYQDDIWKLANASDVMVQTFVFVTPDEDLNTALKQFTSLNLEELPVLQDETSQTLIGMLRRKEVIAEYNRRVMELKSDQSL